ncbi:MAG: hypothetical protein CLLPBCKN_007444 [Chroococcidiopsis cubana SAG 39.79]|uniref:CopG family transcriptional regulator n=1 Tax=Chroococcidiopsis cubana SAG 39.79 TaxID=388085 RepID=A0AB37UUP0_9CYAN|nr:DUF411 domain-containing protein [Chroococcidiopsis cubana]MDZ4878009.1 hypothetical protein [Chroococcidiopsis cubana SAG 39.79]PSB60357.1 DUF411 domain-containing protein [Chroococcidiopsis cubana CCALA 043]RUT14700.1 hypothetical protein DSM107010_02460 [Chroococcidiopsis cubana SAG 39.79]
MKYKQLTQVQNWLRPIVVGAAIGVVMVTYPAVAVAERLKDDSSLVTLLTQSVSISQNVKNERAILPARGREMVVYRSPSCSCCGGWIDYMKKQGFQTKVILTSDIEAVKQKYSVPDRLASCHTAVIDGYVVEGHVPVHDVKRLLQEKPNVVGISVPQMPVGTPGMEMGDRKDPFTVFSFDRQGRAKAFNKYPSS